jgi:hypothetical protein
MPGAEIITAAMSLLALVISATALVRARKVDTKQLEYAAINAALTKKQLERMERDDQIAQKALVTADLVKTSSTNYSFVITNQSTVVASEITFAIAATSPDNPLVEGECQRKLPYPVLQPAQSFTLIAALHMGSSMSYPVQLSWKDPDGSVRSNELHLSI